MRPLSLSLSLALAFSAAGCFDAHTPSSTTDAGPIGDAGCAGGAPFVICVADCGSDAGAGPICVAGAWTCPPGTRNLAECPPTCHGPPPPGCVCRGTSWSCPAPQTDCPVDTMGSIGSACATEGAECGNPCCSDAIECRGGVWAPGPVADCDSCVEHACGDGRCRADQTCVSSCNIAGGTSFVCRARDAGCNDCSCIVLTEDERCEMIDGFPQVTEQNVCF
jgi:hypothetical protein